jgi:NAD(P)-dependent dehydrogenase (short-subunit alcohol dehydrogenase family)
MKALVTGAAGGIGRATAIRLHQDSLARGGAPAELVLVDLHEGRLSAVADELSALGARVQGFAGDLADPEVPAAAVAAAEAALGGLDALISNAGIISRGSLLDLSLAEYERAFAINTRATWLLAKAAYPMLAASRGALVATASIAARAPTPALGAYSLSKAALVMLVKTLANDWGAVGIRCNCVSPGSTDTAIAENSGIPRTGARKGRNPLGMVAPPELQAAAIAFLAGPDAGFITGIDMLVDGGAGTQLMTGAGMGDPWRKE